MNKRRGPWQDGRRAWERLKGWHQDSPPVVPGRPDDGSAAVAALADIGLVRHLLDQAELVAVRAARGHGKSWAEIAIKLGVTRQSAWERWRDLDDDTAGSRSIETSSAQESALQGAVAEVLPLKAQESRRKSIVVVPTVIGLSWHEALRMLREIGLTGIGSDLEGQPPSASSWPGAVVTDQSPEAGAKVPVGSLVTLWRERGGGSAGVREPRQPKPSPKSMREARYEPSDEVIG